MKITWIGHSCFKVETALGSVIFDPYQDGTVDGLGNVRESADLVLCSHEHYDHNGRECVDLTGKDLQAAGLKVTQLHTYHDDTKGSQRGTNIIHIIEDGQEKLAHLGDLGCELTEEEKAQLKDLDAVLVPVGGYYTIDGVKAAEIIKELAPKMIIPMHFKNVEKGFGFPVISEVDEFTNCFAPEKVTFTGDSVIETGREGVFVLVPKCL